MRQNPGLPSQATLQRLPKVALTCHLPLHAVRHRPWQRRRQRLGAWLHPATMPSLGAEQCALQDIVHACMDNAIITAICAWGRQIRWFPLSLVM